MGQKQGWEHKLYRNTGTFGSPTWDLVPNCRDLTMPSPASANDASIRGSRVKMYGAGQIDLSFQWQMVADAADTDYTVLRTAHFAQTAIDLMDLDGPIATSGSLGIRAICQIFTFDQNEPLDGTVLTDVEAKPTYDTTNGGAHLVLGGGSPTFTAI